MSWDDNIYYNPENTGLKLVATHDYSSGFYEFDFFCLWTDGKDIRYGNDSGCSCPTPFEGVKYEELEPIRNLAHLRQLLKSGEDTYQANKDHAHVVAAYKEWRDTPRKRA